MYVGIVLESYLYIYTYICRDVLGLGISFTLGVGFRV